jgi:O-antigen/teichoic acid export membrane protein/glycosyltransferase involved in cell wall biosynthesis
MGITDKVIKNTIYLFFSQVLGFILPLFLTPFIISKIGEIQFGIYALVLGFLGTFGLFDLSVSSSFVKFISEHYNQKDFSELNRKINSGLFFYVIFSLICVAIGLIFLEKLLSLLNIPPDLFDLGVYIFRLSLVIFLITNSTSIFNAILISLQKMYLTSILGMLINILNFVSIIVLLILGFGLKGLIWSQLIAVSMTVILSIIVAAKQLPEMKISLIYFKMSSLKSMFLFGLQMQVSKLASFSSEKYDEFLLGFFSVMNNVTYFNISGRVSRIGRLLPMQLVPQVAPVAAEFNAKKQNQKLVDLFFDTTKYLILVSFPVFVYTFTFSDLLIGTWMGSGFEISAFILKILVVGQLINMSFSAPGNSITPNIGLPKYQMYEGLILLAINIVLSYILIKMYGIYGAAYGTVISTVISSFYVFGVSAKYFKQKYIKFLYSEYFKPLASVLISALVSFSFYYTGNNFIYPFSGRISGVIYIFITGIIFSLTYILLIANWNYLNERNKKVLIKILAKIFPLKKLAGGKLKNLEYNGELVSLFILTYNRLEFLKKSLNSLVLTLENVNYELLICDNNSTDGTREYLDAFKNKEKISEKIKIILNEKNIGTNAKGKCADLTKGDFIIGIDDDVLSFPQHWIQNMIFAYKNVPFMGYLSTDVVQDELTDGAKQPDEAYQLEKYSGGKINLLVGPAGGWCFMISRDVYNEVGKFYSSDKLFFAEDGNYARRAYDRGFKFGILKNIKVYHATGFAHNRNYQNIYDHKLNEYQTDDPLLMKIKNRLIRIFYIKRYFRKLIQLSGIMEDE